MPNYSRTVGNRVSETTTDAHASTVVDLPAERAPHPLHGLVLGQDGSCRVLGGEPDGVGFTLVERPTRREMPGGQVV
ncbi:MULTISPECIES: hypothetical protein [Streptomyces]|uniref:hypothetical protein n=1 Tax=Streptomyces TaxID=1883 RepID=UPI000FD77114|nr:MULTISPECIES: hypothetical protein [unclassified Streptomyces]MCW1097847.1 hypothetical protein [Streptomyces sp. RS2]